MTSTGPCCFLCCRYSQNDKEEKNQKAWYIAVTAFLCNNVKVLWSEDDEYETMEMINFLFAHNSQHASSSHLCRPDLKIKKEF